ncbi:MAG: heparinase II/III family protein [Phycisphaerae bacterium]|nr:heparinase II/III family protein [Phycisphaerae bacterium]
MLGSRQELKDLAKERPQAYQRVVAVARQAGVDDYSAMISMALVCAIDGDKSLGQAAVERAMKYVSGPIRVGHTTFGTDLALCALVYDLCYDGWTAEQRRKCWEYMDKTIEANVQSETHVFHNGWYGYKNWGIGLACYATYYENPRAQEFLRVLQEDWRTRAAPALELAGAGGGWAEGYYINYFLYEWLFFCEVARHCEGVDYYADAPQFFRHRAIASMFEAYPGIGEYGSRRAIPMGDGGGRLFGGDRDKVLSARRILVNHFRDDPEHQVVHAFNETTPRSSVGTYAYKDFLWRDTTVTQGDLSHFRLSHLSPGPGYVYARSSWDEDATYFFFKCGDRFTAHQHLDVGHFLIYQYDELAGDGGHYDEFGTPHDVNYHLRTIAHSTILVHDPCETWPGIRAGTVTGNDGGQHHNWPHHNGAVADPAQWLRERKLYDIADLLAFEDTGAYVYVAGDCTRAYSPQKLSCFTRQIVFLRPGTFVIFDRVCATKPEFKKTWLLQAVKPPTTARNHLVVTNGKGRLFIQTLLPENPLVHLVTGADLYTYGGHSYPPAKNTGPAPECRIEISPDEPQATDYFLHVLTATSAAVADVESATATGVGRQAQVKLGAATIVFTTDKVGGSIELAGRRTNLTETVALPYAQRNRRSRT